MQYLKIRISDKGLIPIDDKINFEVVNKSSY
jgi:hypothetical protein